jgi:hypothetical protein
MSGRARREVPEWWGSPAGWIGGFVPRTFVVARNEAAAILVGGVEVYPTGIGLSLRAMMRPAPRPVIPPPEPAAAAAEDAGPDAGEDEGLGLAFLQVEAPADRTRPEMPSDRVVFGVEFDDGRRAERADPIGGGGDFTFFAHYEGKDVAPDPVTNVILNTINGSGSSDSISENAFVWPLPPGDLRLFGAWTDADLPEQSVSLSADVIAAARARARDAFGASR